ncbi:hypothetical protein [Fodinibius halophilus]|uniref:Peptidase MA-like domain-containing protein n=1 Tax=Fodinibius halophilus TaxID=1736908 RepID=A0A6M1T041_9BACT|nr:hypothetical protein [Fodinibius halophilus]NGP87279.1 hypothetical protein [Fodinibius halophilus]
MFTIDRSFATQIAGPILIGTLLLFVPLLGDFHFESALLASLIGCFWAGTKASKKNHAAGDFFDALRIGFFLFLMGTPLLVNAIFTGCFSIHGLGFWLIFPLPSIFFGYSIGRLFRQWNISYAATLTFLLLLVVAVGIFVYELLTYPQVYFFNHVWGGWPGPIYDEMVVVTDAAVFFRLLTILWALFIWHIPTVGRDKYSAWIVGFASISIALFYPQLPEMGVVSPPAHIQSELGGAHSTKHFELYYDRDHYSKHEIQRIAKEHEFYFSQIVERLQLTYPDSSRITSYLYGHPWQKKKLVGAKFTSYVPVWLQQDQLHIAKQQISGSLKHELVHVLTKQFGNDLFNASWSIGLIEGLAVAVAGGSSSTSTIDQIVVSEKPYPTAKQLENSFSLKGFYGGRSGINYITSGSFVRFLLDKYPVKDIKEAYRTGDLVNSYQADWQTLAKGWHQHLDSVQVDSLDEQTAARIFGYPSLFEQDCPHVVSDFMASWDRYRYAMATEDTTRALRALDQAVATGDSVPPIKAEWSFRHLVISDLGLVQKAASLQDTTVDLQLLYADANIMTGDTVRAKKHLTRAKKLFAEKPDSLLEPALAVRMNKKHWAFYRTLRYNNQLPDATRFSRMHYRSKTRSIKKAITQEHWPLLTAYSRELLRQPVKLRYFDSYQLLIHELAALEEQALATSLLKKVQGLALRRRFKERLKIEKEWLQFLESDREPSLQ